MRRCEFVPELSPKSQLIIIVLQLRWLDQTADLGSSVNIRLLPGRILLLLFNLEQLGVVPGKLLQGDKEVTQVQPELVVLRVECEQALDEDSNLWPGEMLAVVRSLRRVRLEGQNE